MRLFSLLFSLAIAVSAFGGDRPNIVFLLADDLTRWDIACYGSEDSKTPAIDKLARDGMKFTRCYQAAPMCSPTRHNIYKGKYPIRSGAYPNHTNANEGTKSIVHHLKPLGYRVALSGKTHIGPVEVFPFEYLGMGSNPDFELVDAFVQDAVSKDEPFCLFLTSNEPHTPWDKGDNSVYDREKIKLPPYYVDNAETRENFCLYLAEINYLDGQVKQALELLEKNGVRENTVFIFASEQGNAFPFAKWTCYNAGLGSALIVSWPGMVEPGSVSDALVEYSDITPTMIDLAGGDPVKGLDGKSLVPVLKGKKTSHKKYTYGEMTTRGIINGSDYYPVRSVSNGTYRYILNPAWEVEFSNVAKMPGWEESAKTEPRAAELIQKHKYRPAVELFNDQEDPYNQANLAGQQEYKKIQKKLDKQLKKWMSYSGDEGVLTELLAFEHMNRGTGDNLKLVKDFNDARPSGNLEVPVSGYYTFYITGQGSIYVNDQLIAKGNPEDENGKRFRYGIIALKQGLHQVDLKEPGEGTWLQWSGPNLQSTDLILK